MAHLSPTRVIRLNATSAGLMLVQRRRRLTSIKPALAQIVQEYLHVKLTHRLTKRILLLSRYVMDFNN